MKKKDRPTIEENPTIVEENKKDSIYNDSVFDAFDKSHSSGVIQVQPDSDAKIEENQVLDTDVMLEMKQPNKLYRRNITLSEEQFRKLELIKKLKNKERGKDDELVTLDKLMFDMIQQCLDSNQYPEVNVAFEKYKELKKLGYGDLM